VLFSITCILSSLLLPSLLHASPVSSLRDFSSSGLPLPSLDSKSWFCRLVHTTLAQELCPGEESTAISVNTPLGTAQGVVDVPGVNRFAAKYAFAERWSPSAVVTAWTLPYVNHIAPDLLPITYTLPRQQWFYKCIIVAAYVPAAICR
jgi:hypothetical protein